jgi:hypothetical protein
VYNNSYQLHTHHKILIIIRVTYDESKQLRWVRNRLSEGRLKESQLCYSSEIGYVQLISINPY